jgi:hypothetical protein
MVPTIAYQPFPKPVVISECHRGGELLAVYNYMPRHGLGILEPSASGGPGWMGHGP